MRQRQRPEDHRARYEEGSETGGHSAAPRQGPLGRGTSAGTIEAKVYAINHIQLSLNEKNIQ